MMRTYRGKRLLDLTVAIIGFIVLAPIMGIIAILIRYKLGSPILFKQTRPGLHGKPFTIYKFRTMSDATNANGTLRSDADRLSTFGQVLRSSSLDELPELWNVIKGEMSIVGPRPLLMQYLERYTPEQAQRHNARPGITGWAQINGRNAISWEEKFELDIWYVENLSVWLDVKIIWLTLSAVINRRGINAAQSATMPEFIGQASQSREESFEHVN